MNLEIMINVNFNDRNVINRPIMDEIQFGC